MSGSLHTFLRHARGRAEYIIGFSLQLDALTRGRPCIYWSSLWSSRPSVCCEQSGLGGQCEEWARVNRNHFVSFTTSELWQVVFSSRFIIWFYKEWGKIRNVGPKWPAKSSRWIWARTEESAVPGAPGELSWTREEGALRGTPPTTEASSLWRVMPASHHTWSHPAPSMTVLQLEPKSPTGCACYLHRRIYKIVWI